MTIWLEDPGILKSYYCHTLNTLNPRNLNRLHSDSETVHFSDIGTTNLIPITVQLTIQQT